MTDWKIVKLGKVIKFGNGKKKPDSDGIIPIYGGNGILGYSSESNYTNETIIIGRVGAYCGSVYYENKPIWISDNALSAKPKDSNDTKFLYYFLKHASLNQHAGGSSHPLVTQTLLNSLEYSFCVKPSEQKAIAEVLSSLDDKIDLLHRQNKTLEELAQTLFRQWIIEEAKDEWEKVTIKDFDVSVTDYVANGSFASLAENVTYKQEPDFAVLIRLTDYNRNFAGDFVYVDERAYNFLSKSQLNGGEIIISNVGAYAGTVFKAPKLNSPMTLGPNSIVLKSDFNNYFYLLFKSDYGKHLLDGIMSGSAQPKFNKTAFRAIELNYPSKQYLINFENIIKPYFNKIESNQQQVKTLENIRDTLLPKLLSGEVRVKNGY